MPGEVEQRTTQPVHLVDQQAIHLAGLDLFKQLLQRGTVHVAAAETAVIKAGLDQSPAQMPLTLDVGFSSLALCIERIEGLF